VIEIESVFISIVTIAQTPDAARWLHGQGRCPGDDEQNAVAGNRDAVQHAGQEEQEAIHQAAAA
jgi:hypothetical protein